MAQLDVDALIARYRERAAAVKERGLPPVAGEERKRFIEQAELDYLDFSLIGNARWTVEDDDLVPDLAGIRAKLQAPGEGFRDFVVAEESARGLPGLVNMVGIDSPGLTSSLALAEAVDHLLPA